MCDSKMIAENASVKVPMSNIELLNMGDRAYCLAIRHELELHLIKDVVDIVEECGLPNEVNEIMFRSVVNDLQTRRYWIPHAWGSDSIGGLV